MKSWKSLTIIAILMLVTSSVLPIAFAQQQKMVQPTNSADGLPNRTTVGEIFTEMAIKSGTDATCSAQINPYYNGDYMEVGRGKSIYAIWVCHVYANISAMTNYNINGGVQVASDHPALAMLHMMSDLKRGNFELEDNSTDTTIDMTLRVPYYLGQAPLTGGTMKSFTIEAYVAIANSTEILCEKKIRDDLTVKTKGSQNDFTAVCLPSITPSKQSSPNKLSTADYYSSIKLDGCTIKITPFAGKTYTIHLKQDSVHHSESYSYRIFPTLSKGKSTTTPSTSPASPVPSITNPAVTTNPIISKLFETISNQINSYNSNVEATPSTTPNAQPNPSTTPSEAMQTEPLQNELNETPNNC
ncbi:MAG: hypothetical protein FE034_00805 [Thermoplasmata archaeon]|nr:MAG: hypothetical protein FE034_00805 [Thermoplasmata archaeon]